jgi:hypothetical protein
MAKLVAPNYGSDALPKPRRKSHALAAIVNSYRRKIFHYYPKAVFDTEFTLGINTTQWAEYIESIMEPGMTWENYNIKWCMVVVKSADKFDFSDAAQFYEYYNYMNYKPRWKKPNGFVADPNNPSPLDRYAD